MSGRLVHFEIPYDDGERAQAFYAQTFGWQLMPVPGMEYTMVMTGPSDPETGPSEPGFINGGLFKRAEPFKGPNIIIDVPSVDDALKSVEASGGTIVQGREPVGDLGFCGYFTDTEGNLLGLWENA